MFPNDQFSVLGSGNLHHPGHWRRVVILDCDLQEFRHRDRRFRSIVTDRGELRSARRFESNTTAVAPRSHQRIAPLATFGRG